MPGLNLRTGIALFSTKKGLQNRSIGNKSGIEELIKIPHITTLQVAYLYVLPWLQQPPDGLDKLMVAKNHNKPIFVILLQILERTMYATNKICKRFRFLAMTVKWITPVPETLHQGHSFGASSRDIIW